MGLINELRQKYSQLMKNRIKLLASIDDFNLLTYVLLNSKKMTEGKIVQQLDYLYHFSTNEIAHCIDSIDSCLNSNEKKDKLDFSLKSIIQINSLMNGKATPSEELLQALYMSIFAKYNDDMKKDDNYKITPEFAKLVYVFDGEELPEKARGKHTSEKDIGVLYIDERTYRSLLNTYIDKGKEVYRIQMVTYVLSIIRNKMMHGDFENIKDSEGNSIVQIYGNNFKSKFFFDCILEFYEAISEEIKGKKEQEDPLFDLEALLLQKSNIDPSIISDKDKLMTMILPLYVNSFITYNFSQQDTDINSLREICSNNDAKAHFLSLYYSDDENSFANKVAEYNRDNEKSNYTPEEIITIFRNCIVHNNYECKNGIITFSDKDKNGVEDARIVIPYNLIEELIRRQSEQAKIALEQTEQESHGTQEDQVEL